MMKNKAEQPKKWGTSVLLAAMLLTVLSLSQPAFSQVNLAGSWATGTSHTKEAGTDRALIFIAHGELTSSMNLSDVSYGGQSMTKVIDRNYYSGSGAYAYAAAYILNEAGVAAASSGTFTVTWSATPSEVKYASVFLSNVNQTTLVGASASGGGTTNPVTTSALATSNNDMVIDAATCGNTGTYTLNNGFTQGTYQSSGSSTGVTGYKSATGASETPSASHSNISGNRQTIIGFVVQGMASDPNKASNPDPFNGATNVGVTTDLSWTAGAGATSHDVYFGTDSNAHNSPKHTVDTNSYDPPGDLEIDTTYYWAVDSNDDGTIHPGDDWNFTTLIPVQVGDRVAGNMMLINDNGGWCWYQDEKIIYDPVSVSVITSTAAHSSGFGGAGNTRGNDVDATTFNIATGNRTRALICERGGDDHNIGAFWIRPDGRYLHVYARHNSDDLSYYRISTNPHDSINWNSELNYNWVTISGLPDVSQLTYSNLLYLSAEGTGSGRIYNIVREFDNNPNISYSDDLGVTWHYAGRITIYSGSSSYSNGYFKFNSNGVDRIDFLTTEHHPRNYNNSIYHGYIKNKKSYNSYGVEIDPNVFDQDAPHPEDFTRVFLADQTQDANHTAWTVELERDSQGQPVCLFTTRHGTEAWGDGSGQANIGAADHRLFYGRFDGSAWHYTELCKMGTGLHTPEQDYTGLGCIHPDDANLIYISTPFDPRDDSELEHHEIFKGVTYDNGATWNWTQITFDSTVDNIRPAIPKWDAYNTAVFWTRGSYPGQENYDFAVVGMVEEENKTLGLVNYIDASPSNTKNADDTNFAPTGPSGNAGTADSRWHEYTGYGNGGSCYTAGDGGTENVPTIKTTITGLSDGTYDVFAYFWCDPDANWGIRGGFESSDLLCFNKQSSQFAEASQFSGPVDVIDTEILYRVYIGRKELSRGGSIVVYLDNYDSTFTGNKPARTTYDGVGVASVITGYAGDLNGDGKVNLVDIAVLGQGWLTIYDIYTLADIADNWLIGI